MVDGWLPAACGMMFGQRRTPGLRTAAWLDALPTLVFVTSSPFRESVPCPPCSCTAEMQKAMQQAAAGVRNNPLAERNIAELLQA